MLVKHNDSANIVHFSCLGLKKNNNKKSRPTDPLFSRHVTTFFLAIYMLLSYECFVSCHTSEFRFLGLVSLFALCLLFLSMPKFLNGI